MIRGDTLQGSSRPMIVFNWLAAGMVLISMVIGYAIQAVTGAVGQNNILAVTIGFGLAALFDVYYRWDDTEGDGLKRFVLPWKGGHLMFLPLWLIAIIMIGFAASEEMK